MRIYSFGRDAGQRVERYGSDFVLTPLTDPKGSARVACFHLAPGESVGEHGAVGGQLFCVVAGRGWVSGDDDERVAIDTHQAAYWTSGERHAAGSEAGLTAIVLEGDDFEVRARLVEMGTD